MPAVSSACSRKSQTQRGQKGSLLRRRASPSRRSRTSVIRCRRTKLAGSEGDAEVKRRVCFCCRAVQPPEHSVFCERCRDLLDRCDVDDPNGTFLTLRKIVETRPPRRPDRRDASLAGSAIPRPGDAGDKARQDYQGDEHAASSVGPVHGHAADQAQRDPNPDDEPVIHWRSLQRRRASAIAGSR
jgi:hypothetical protein